jgi:hypothetical protein
MTNQDLEIEDYGGGFIIADYSGKVQTPYGARYRGKSGVWKTQPVISLDDVFQSEAEAMAAIASEKVFVDQEELDALKKDLF